MTSWKFAVRSISTNKLRAFLTLLGIIIGIASVIVTIAVGQGAKQKVTSQIQSLGANLLIVSPGAGGGAIKGGGSVQTLTAADATAIAQLPLVTQVAPEVPAGVTAVYQSNTWTTGVDGTTPALQTVKNWPLTEGSFITQSDVNGAAAVAVLGQTVVANLYPAGVNPVGTTVLLNSHAYSVEGVLSAKGVNASGQDQDNVIDIPITNAQTRLLGVNSLKTINVEVSNQQLMNGVQLEISQLLHQRHHIVPPNSNDFNVRNQSSILAAAQASSSTLTVLLASVATVSLLVGGIGIMNIMLVSVTERTREIGIRMAVGARGAAILSQFLVEALLLAFVGGLLGIVAGVAGSKLVASLAGFPTLLSVQPVVAAVFFSAAVGLFFGFYPARKASRLDPIDALRYE